MTTSLRHLNEYSARLDQCLPGLMLGMRRNLTRLATDLGLNPSQLLILMELGFKAKPVKMSSLAYEAGMKVTALTPAVDFLISKKMARRFKSEQDRRVIQVVLTPLGIKKLKTLRKFHLENIKILMSRLSVAQRVAVVEAAEKSLDLFKTNIFFENNRSKK
jgi:DNA-binding MarR family transcriptional regulator